MSFVRYEIRKYGFVEELFGYGLKWYKPCSSKEAAISEYKKDYKGDDEVAVYKVTLLPNDEIVEKVKC